MRLRCPSRTPEIARFPRQEKAMLHCDLSVRWKVASDLRFRAAISDPKTPSFCGISGDLAQSTRKSLAIAIVRFWCAKIKNEKHTRTKKPFQGGGKRQGVRGDGGKMRFGVFAGKPCIFLVQYRSFSEFWHCENQERALGHRRKVARFCCLSSRLYNLVFYSMPFINRLETQESVSTGVWCVPGFGAGFEIALQPSKLQKEGENVEKGTFIFCAKIWCAPNPGSTMTKEI